MTQLPNIAHVFSETLYSTEDLDLMERYPAPMAARFSVSHVLLEPELRRETYAQRMHQLLHIEEMAQFSSIAK